MSTGIASSTPSNSPHSRDDGVERILRHRRQATKVRVSLGCLATAAGWILSHERDFVAEQLASDMGYLPHDLIFMRLHLRTCEITAVIVPPRLWYRPDRKGRVLQLKRKLKRAGLRPTLVPSCYLNRQPQLQNAQLIASTAAVQVTATNRMRVAALLLEDPCSTISDCVQVLPEHPDPFGAVLKLVIEGTVEVDMSKPITPHSMISLAATR